MGDFLSHNNIVIGSRHDPSPYVLCLGQALADPALAGQAVSSAFDKGEWNGVWHCKIRKAAAVLQMPKQFCVVAQKIPHVTEILRSTCVRI